MHVIPFCTCTLRSNPEPVYHQQRMMDKSFVKNVLAVAVLVSVLTLNMAISVQGANPTSSLEVRDGGDLHVVLVPGHSFFVNGTDVLAMLRAQAVVITELQSTIATLTTTVKSQAASIESLTTTATIQATQITAMDSAATSFKVRENLREDGIGHQRLFFYGFVSLSCLVDLSFPLARTSGVAVTHSTSFFSQHFKTSVQFPMHPSCASRRPALWPTSLRSCRRRSCRRQTLWV